LKSTASRLRFFTSDVPLPDLVQRPDRVRRQLVDGGDARPAEGNEQGDRGYDHRR
jgi:hypothetical protein